MPIDEETIASNTKQRYIAFFDIMGFTDLCYRGNHSDVAKIMARFVEITDSAHTVSTINFLDEPVAPSKIVHTAVFSDSVILYTADTSQTALQSIIRAISFLLYDCFETGIPIKGSMAKGLFTASKKESLYFGRPLIDAYKLADELHFYGAAAHHSAEEDIEKYLQLSIESDPQVIRYPTPLKSGNINHYIFAPPSGKWYLLKTDYSQMLKKFYTTASGGVRKYVDNTEKVYHHILSLPSEEPDFKTTQQAPDLDPS